MKLTSKVKKVHKEQATLVRLLQAEWCALLGSPYTDAEHKRLVRSVKAQLEYEERKLASLERAYPDLKGASRGNTSQPEN